MNRPVPFIVSIPAAVFIAVAGLSVLWTEDLVSGENVLAYFLLPFALLVVVVAHAPFPPWLPKALAVIAVGLATLFAVVGIIQAATHKLWFFSPAVEVGNAYSSFFRVTSLFRDPSLYGRHVVIGIVVLLVCVLYRKVNPFLAAGLIALLFVGLWFSYSQSSMAALFVVTLALAAVAGGRSLKLVAALTAVVVLVGAAGILATSVQGPLGAPLHERSLAARRADLEGVPRESGRRRRASAASRSRARPARSRAGRRRASSRTRPRSRSRPSSA